MVSFSSLVAALLIVFVSTLFVQNGLLQEAQEAREIRQAAASDLIAFMLVDFPKKLAPIGRLDVLDDAWTKAAEYFMTVPPEQLSDEELFRQTEQMRLMGNVRLQQGQTERALAIFSDAQTLSEGLLRRDSTNASWLLGLATNHFWLGNIGFLQNDLDQALEHFTAYRDLSEKLVELHPDSLSYRLELSYAQSGIGTVLQSMGDHEGALREFVTTLEQRKPLAAIQPDNAEFQSALATAYNKLAVEQQRSGDLVGALAHHRAELEVRQALVARDTADRPARWMLSLAHSYLGELLMATGDAESALEQRLAAWRIHQDLVRWDAANVAWQRSLAISARLAGLGLAHAGRADEGLAALADSRDILLRLVDSDATSVDYRQELAKTESALAIAHLDEQPDEAVAAARRSLEALAPLKATSGGDASFLSIESSAYLELGRSLAAVGRIDEAREAWASALSLSRSSGATEGIDHLVTLASTLLHLGRVDEARPIAHTLVQRGYRQPDFVTLARRNGLIASSDR